MAHNIIRGALFLIASFASVIVETLFLYRQKKLKCFMRQKCEFSGVKMIYGHQRERYSKLYSQIHSVKSRFAIVRKASP